jgi:hypothetical protein
MDMSRRNAHAAVRRVAIATESVNVVGVKAGWSAALTMVRRVAWKATMSIALPLRSRWRTRSGSRASQTEIRDS